jgi:hypothetical protein
MPQIPIGQAVVGRGQSSGEQGRTRIPGGKILTRANLAAVAYTPARSLCIEPAKWRRLLA